MNDASATGLRAWTLHDAEASRAHPPRRAGRSPAAPSARPDVAAFFDPRTSSVQYVVSDPASRACAIIDPVLDYDETSGSVATRSADALLDYVAREGFGVAWILDTHPHADHVSAAHLLHERTGAPTAIGVRIGEVQKLWADIYGLPSSPAPYTLWDRLFDEGDTFRIGGLEARVLFSPGHTLASISYLIGDAAFVHDTLFMPDGGTARADFPGGDASALWRSIQAILALPEQTRLFTGHDYQPGGREPRWGSTVAEQKAANIHLQDQSQDGFVAMRQARDASMPLPKPMLHALQVNIRGGRLPEPEGNGRRYLKLPLDAFPNAPWSKP